MSLTVSRNQSDGISLVRPPAVEVAVESKQVQLERQRQVCDQVRRECESRRQSIAETQVTLALRREKYSSFLSQHLDKRHDCIESRGKKTDTLLLKRIQVPEFIYGVPSRSHDQNKQTNTTPVNCEFEALLDYLKQVHGFDFTGYKRASLTRRVLHRMQLLQIDSYCDYLDYLKLHLEESAHLFNTILINFTSFFRDASAWQYVAAQIVPRLIAGKSESEPIRVWNAGCASGEETYTLAIVLAEALGVEQYNKRVQIFSTDVDEEALKQAVKGSYVSSQVAGIPPTLLQRYFEPADDRYVFRKDLCRSILFCRHNMIEDAPMSNIDLLVCRNVLIYFEIEAQMRSLARFHFGLKDSGFLFLGSAEMVPTHTKFFTSVDTKQRVMTKIQRGDANQSLLNKALNLR